MFKDIILFEKESEIIKKLELDGVIVIHRNGTTFLRTSPDKTRTNNLSNTKITTASFNSNRTTPL